MILIISVLLRCWRVTAIKRKQHESNPWKNGTNTLFPWSANAANACRSWIDEALALAGETGERWSDAFLHRLRGEILLKCNPANTAPAEDALLAAIAIAQQQKARSFDLRAALDLARLYNSTRSSADAHAVLASALKGFSPTPEFPEIEQTPALLAALAEADEVKNASASRHAAKYGALSNESGKVAICWTIAGDGKDKRLKLKWEETGGPPVVAPTRHGFGISLLKATFTDVRVDYVVEGLSCEIDLLVGYTEPDTTAFNSQKSDPDID